jgi:hypothetical protein
VPVLVWKDGGLELRQIDRKGVRISARTIFFPLKSFLADATVHAL